MRKQNKMISIIIPIYNGEKYINKCVESILNQTYKEIQLILVDDGSTDKTLEICNAYMKKDERIVVIHQDNSGVHSARNKGMSISKGAYITFVDADDYLEDEYLEKMYQAIEENNVDIVCGGHKEIIEKENRKTEIKEYTFGNKIINTADEYFTAYCKFNLYFTWVVWGKLYKKECLKNQLFANLKYGEDTLFMMSVFSNSPSLYLENCPGYCHLVWEGSVVNDSKKKGIAPKYLSDMLEMKYNLYKIYRNIELSDLNKKKAQYNYANEVYWYLMSNERNSSYSEHQHTKRVYKQNIRRAKQTSIKSLKMKIVFNTYLVCADGVWMVQHLLNKFRK